MSDLLVELLLPRTDRGAGVQAALGAVALGLALWRVRTVEVRWFVGGVGALTFGWFALRTVH